jgi:hypothetical protein
MSIINQIKNTNEFKKTSNRFFKLIRKYCQDWEDLHKHPLITWDIIKENPSVDWSSYTSLNPNITWDIVQQNPDFNWNINYLAGNPNITINIIQNNKDKFKYVNYHPREPNDFLRNLVRNPNISWEMILNLTKANFPSADYNQNLNVTFDFIRQHCMMLNYYEYFELCISKHPDLTWEFVLENINCRWDWYKLSKHPNISFEIIRDNPEYNWSYFGIIENPNFTLELVEKVINGELWSDKFITAYTLSINPNLTWEFIQRYSILNWNYEALSYHPNITCDIIENNPNKPWVWQCISDNPNLTLDFLERYEDKPINWYRVCLNPLKKEVDKIINIINKKREEERFQILLCFETNRIPHDISKEVCKFI